MSRAGVPVLIATLVLLGGALYRESIPQLPDLSAPAGRSVVPPPPAPVAAPPSRTAEWVGTILARPLFSPTRRPFQTAAESKASPEVPRLAGVVIGGGEAVAIFAGPGAKPIFARAGERVGPYSVKSIAAGQVIVEGGSGTQVLHPVFAQHVAAQQPATARPQLKPPGDQATAAEIPSPETVRRLIERQAAQRPK